MRIPEDMARLLGGKGFTFFVGEYQSRKKIAAGILNLVVPEKTCTCTHSKPKK